MTLVWAIPLPSAGDKLVLLALADNANDAGECWPSIDTIAEKCSMNWRSVIRHLGSLEKMQAIVKAPRTNRSTVYTITLVKMTPPVELSPAKVTPTTCQNDTTDHCQNDTPPLSKLTGTPCQNDTQNHQGIVREPPKVEPPNESSLLFDGAQNPSNGKKRKRPAKPKPETDSGPTWKAYSTAYFARYQAEPVRNRMVNGQIAQLIARVGKEEAPHIAAYFLRHNAKWYVEKMHPVGLLLQDCEKLRTEWATHRTVTSSEARQTDKTQARGDVWGNLIAEVERKDREKIQ